MAAVGLTRGPTSSKPGGIGESLDTWPRWRASPSWVSWCCRRACAAAGLAATGGATAGLEPGPVPELPAVGAGGDGTDRAPAACRWAAAGADGAVDPDVRRVAVGPEED